MEQCCCQDARSNNWSKHLHQTPLTLQHTVSRSQDQRMSHQEHHQYGWPQTQRMNSTNGKKCFWWQLIRGDLRCDITRVKNIKDPPFFWRMIFGWRSRGRGLACQPQLMLILTLEEFFISTLEEAGFVNNWFWSMVVSTPTVTLSLMLQQQVIIWKNITSFSVRAMRAFKFDKTHLL